MSNLTEDCQEQRIPLTSKMQKELHEQFRGWALSQLPTPTDEEWAAALKVIEEEKTAR